MINKKSDKKKVRIINTSGSVKFIDIDGKKETDDIITLGVNGSEIFEVTPTRLNEMKIEFRGILVIKEV